MGKFGVVIEARLESSRLPGKVLAKLWKNHSILEVIIERFGQVFSKTDIIVATTTNKSDGAIVDVGRNNGVNVFKGSECDVLDRVFRTANEFDLDWVIEITGDNPFADPWVTKRALKSLIDSKMVLCSTDLHWHNHEFDLFFPIGLGFKIFDRAALDFVWKNCRTAADREHVINGMVKSHKVKKINWDWKKIEDAERFRLTVDYPEDLVVVRHVAAYSPNGIYSDSEEIMQYLRSNAAVLTMNANCRQTKYSDKV